MSGGSELAPAPIMGSDGSGDLNGHLTSPTSVSELYKACWDMFIVGA